MVVPAIVASNCDPEYTYSLLRLPFAYSAITFLVRSSSVALVFPIVSRVVVVYRCLRDR